MSQLKLLLYSLASGILFALAWPALGELTSIIFIAFVPLLWVEHQISEHYRRSGFKVFYHSYLTFFTFNIITTYWIYHASLWGAVMAIVCNSLFMAIVFWLFHITKKKVGKKEGYVGFVVFWLAFEYLHINWELSWTWLTLGNVFAATPSSVQWYEYTGVLGGSLFILIANLIFFKGVLQNKLENKPLSKYFLFYILFIGTGKLVSIFAFDSQPNGEERQVVIIQPNIDPYFDKFQGKSESEQIDLFVDLIRKNIDSETDLVVLPETAFPVAFWQHELEWMYGTEQFRKILKDYPQLEIITGILTSKLYLNKNELSETAKKLPGKGWYDNYNAAMFLDTTNTIQIHKKSKLVLGAEKIPFMKQLPFMKKLSISLGGTTGRYGYQDSPSVFASQHSKSVVAPIICYESIYGEYVTQYTQKGANLFSIITNDGWWDNTPGYKQHLAYASLRAIENRRSIVRSANTGISAIINQQGEIVESTEWWEEAILKGKVNLNDEITFYVRYGDYLGRTAGFVAILLLLLTGVKSLNKTGQRLSLKKS